MILVYSAPTFDDFTDRGVAQARSGRPGPGDYELSIGIGTAGGQLSQIANVTWTSGVPLPFTFRSDGTTLRCTIGAATVAHVIGAGPVPFDGLKLVARTVPAGTGVLLDQMHLVAGPDAAPIPDLGASGVNDIHSLLVSASVAGGFTLTGRIAMSWTGAFPTGSRIIVLLKVGVLPAMVVPELLSGAEDRVPKRRSPVRYPLLLLPSLLTAYAPDWSAIMPDILARAMTPPQAPSEAP